ncbi:hypothetical protein [Variovorax sp. UMC13]|uniref:hypothetical protein n=1 Tax=Variovorax sp. UMC13 TaxID=1862326 RepID=UPI0016049ECF|nr:hypothetical protein [Variovorax sp. UMC13]
MNPTLVPGAPDMPLRRLEEAQAPAALGGTGRIDPYRDGIIMKKQETSARRRTGRAARRWHFHWGWAFALALGLGFLAVFGLLDMSASTADGRLHAHPFGTFHASLLLLVAALGLAFLDFLSGRAKGR